MSESEYLVKVLQRQKLEQKQEDVKRHIYVHSKWLEDATELEFMVSCGNSCYRAVLKHDEIRVAADELEQPYDEFFKECKQALTTQLGVPGFDYDIDEDECIFKLLKCTGFETLYLDVALRRVTDCTRMLDAAIELSKRAPGDDVNAVEEETKAKQILAEYEKFVETSRLTEQKMLKKFLLLINAKKERINELEGKLRISEKSDQEQEEDDENYMDATQALTQQL
ncbi:uncharacterized protein LOC108598916 [Drosophila busckii]|uniref:uncharacterized protein LOC108598916 n=1 Tax=Drosophila busckii TaxID=30019 RepID=UPI001432B83B|nr:uncharacterized protein LOC108598916 [Drosophila busckii]